MNIPIFPTYTIKKNLNDKGKTSTVYINGESTEVISKTYVIYANDIPLCIIDEFSDGKSFIEAHKAQFINRAVGLYFNQG